jgi:membrane-associated phospholipid phosphatase
MHAGALASFVTAGAVRSRLWPWAVCGTLAFARVLALAHWPSGVIGGLAIGVLVERLWRPLKRRGYASRPRATPSHA